MLKTIVIVRNLGIVLWNIDADIQSCAWTEEGEVVQLKFGFEQFKDFHVFFFLSFLVFISSCVFLFYV